MTRIVFRPEAEADLTAIALYVAQHSPARAHALIDRLRKRCTMLETHPHAGRPRPELGDGLRSLVERPYVLIYRAVADGVEIVAILHGARDLPRSLTSRLSREEP